MLTSAEIKTRRLLQNDEPACYRSASYDLRIGRIVTPSGELADFYLVPPQGIVEVVSEERVNLPRGVAGFAMVKTHLCNQGLLALNIGIVDPGYQGKLASFLVNFGRTERPLRRNDVFLRLVFHSLEGEYDLASPLTVVNDDRYVAEKQANMQTNFAREFLDIPAVTNKVAGDIFKQYLAKALTYVGLVAAGLALLTFFLNFGNLILVQHYLQPSDETRAALLEKSLEQKDKDISDKNSDLNERISELTARLSSVEKKMTENDPKEVPRPKEAPPQ